jgi:hypothetical protein
LDVKSTPNYIEMLKLMGIATTTLDHSLPCPHICNNDFLSDEIELEIIYPIWFSSNQLKITGISIKGSHKFNDCSWLGAIDCTLP